jgi:hypothetical protein
LPTRQARYAEGVHDAAHIVAVREVDVVGGRLTRAAAVERDYPIAGSGKSGRDGFPRPGVDDPGVKQHERRAISSVRDVEAPARHRDRALLHRFPPGPNRTSVLVVVQAYGAAPPRGNPVRTHSVESSGDHFAHDPGFQMLSNKRNHLGNEVVPHVSNDLDRPRK